MGVVYQARQLGFNRLVALKMILAGSYAGDDERERFRIEAEAVARLQHPNIVQVHEVGEHEGKPFFSMEFCPGGGLDRKLNGTPLPPKEAAVLVETLARAVQAAHDKGVIHRDLKPANVLLAEDGTPKVMDFGLAKRLDEKGLTATGAVMGTPSYMAPEQAGGKTRDIGPADGRVCAGGDPVRVPDRPAAVQGADDAGHAGAGAVGRPGAAAAVAAADAARSGDDLSEMSGEAAGPAVRDGGGAGGRPGTVAAGRAGAAQPPSLGYVLGKWVRRYRTPLAVAAGMLLLLAAVVTTAFVMLLAAWGTAQKNFETADQKGKDVEKTSRRP